MTKEEKLSNSFVYSKKIEMLRKHYLQVISNDYASDFESLLTENVTTNMEMY